MQRSLHGPVGRALSGASTLAAAMSDAFRHRIRVRYSECDLQGVVFNANYLTYLDEAMTELLRAAPSTAATRGWSSGAWTWSWPRPPSATWRRRDSTTRSRSRLAVAPARHDRHDHLHTACCRGGETLTEAELRHVFVHAREGGKRPIPAVRRAVPQTSATWSRGALERG